MKGPNLPTILLAGVLSLVPLSTSAAHDVQNKCAELFYKIKGWSPPSDISEGVRLAFEDYKVSGNGNCGEILIESYGKMKEGILIKIGGTLYFLKEMMGEYKPFRLRAKMRGEALLEIKKTFEP